MRYHHEKPAIYLSMYGDTYECDHPAYRKCTLFKIGDNGLAVIQQRKERAGLAADDLYPTTTVRQIMRALKMNPLKKERWETTFDRRTI